MRFRYAALFAGPLAAACSVLPWSGAPGVPGGTAAHRVVYTVRCDQCRIGYTTGTGMAEAEAKGMWSKTVNLQTTVNGVVTLTAFPTTAASLVSHAYIEVDGKKVAETRRNTRAVFSDEVTLTARLPGVTPVGPDR